MVRELREEIAKARSLTHESEVTRAEVRRYTGIMQQGYDYAFVGGSPDQVVIESWVQAPDRCLPETGEFTFTRSVIDFVNKFVKKEQPKP